MTRYVITNTDLEQDSDLRKSLVEWVRGLGLNPSQFRPQVEFVDENGDAEVRLENKVRSRNGRAVVDIDRNQEAAQPLIVKIDAVPGWARKLTNMRVHWATEAARKMREHPALANLDEDTVVAIAALAVKGIEPEALLGAERAYARHEIIGIVQKMHDDSGSWDRRKAFSQLLRRIPDQDYICPPAKDRIAAFQNDEDGSFVEYSPERETREQALERHRAGRGTPVATV